MSHNWHSQIVSPASDDAASVGQVLGTRSDIQFEEYGELPLTAGQQQAVIAFDYEKWTAGYVFDYLYVKGTDTPPDAIIVVPQSQSTTGFTVQFSGQPVTNNSVLVWKIVTPDNLHVSQPPAAPPTYAIVRPAQSGSQALVSGETDVSVTFPEVHPDNDWGFEQIWIQKAFTEAEPETFSWTCTAKSTSGFSLKLSGAPSDSDYTLHYQIR